MFGWFFIKKLLNMVLGYVQELKLNCAEGDCHSIYCSCR
jgi:hypothetical protein